MEDPPVYTEAELKALKGSLAGLVRQVAESRGILITYVDSKSKKVKTKTKPQLIKALAALRHSVAPNRLDAIPDEPVAGQSTPRPQPAPPARLGLRRSTRQAAAPRASASRSAAVRSSRHMLPPPALTRARASPALSPISTTSLEAGPSNVLERPRQGRTLQGANLLDDPIEVWSAVDDVRGCVRPSAAGPSPAKITKTSPVKLGPSQPLRFVAVGEVVPSSNPSSAQLVDEPLHDVHAVSIAAGPSRSAARATTATEFQDRPEQSVGSVRAEAHTISPTADTDEDDTLSLPTPKKRLTAMLFEEPVELSQTTFEETFPADRMVRQPLLPFAARVPMLEPSPKTLSKQHGLDDAPYPSLHSVEGYQLKPAEPARSPPVKRTVSQYIAEKEANYKGPPRLVWDPYSTDKARAVTRDSGRGSSETEGEDGTAENESGGGGDQGSQDAGGVINTQSSTGMSLQDSCPPPRNAQSPRPWPTVDPGRQQRHDDALKMMQADAREAFPHFLQVITRRDGFSLSYDIFLPVFKDMWRAAAPRRLQYDISEPQPGEPASPPPSPPPLRPAPPTTSQIASQASSDSDSSSAMFLEPTPPEAGPSGIRRGSGSTASLPSQSSSGHSHRAGPSGILQDDDYSVTACPLDPSIAGRDGDDHDSSASQPGDSDEPAPSVRLGKRRHKASNESDDEESASEQKKRKTAKSKAKVDKGKGRASD